MEKRSRLGMTSLNREQLLTLARRVRSGMTDNPHFPDPDPPVEVLSTEISRLTDQLRDYAALRSELRRRRVEMDATVAELRALLRRVAHHVDNRSEGDAEKILSAGLDVRREPTPLRMPALTRLEAGPGRDEGTVRLSWERCPARPTYEIQRALEDPGGRDSWEHAALSTRSRVLLTGQPSGSRLWYRVRAVSPRGAGAWSDPASSIVP